MRQKKVPQAPPWAGMHPHIQRQAAYVVPGNFSPPAMDSGFGEKRQEVPLRDAEGGWTFYADSPSLERWRQRGSCPRCQLSHNSTPTSWWRVEARWAHRVGPGSGEQRKEGEPCSHQDHSTLFSLLGQWEMIFYMMGAGYPQFNSLNFLEHL